MPHWFPHRGSRQKSCRSWRILTIEDSATLKPTLVKYHSSMYSAFFMRVAAMGAGMLTWPIGMGALITGANFFLFFFHSSALAACHDRDNSRLAPSENARKANTGTRERTRASAAPPPNRTPASERATRARSLLVLFLLSPFSPYLLYLDSSLSSRLIGIHMYPSALHPSRLTFYD